jgi:hypothetical protein
MKLTKVILSAVAVVGLAVSAQAQLGFDLFAVPRVVEFSTNAGVSSTTAQGSVASWSNAPIDLSPFAGKAIVLVDTTLPNSVTTTGSLTVQFFGSPDTTNWYPYTNYATISAPTQFPFTNSNPLLRGGTNAAATNYTLFPFGNITYPTGATAGFTTPYATNLLFNGGAAITITAAGTYAIGFNLANQYRYLNAIFTPSATSGSNFIATAKLVATPATPIGD